HPSAARDRTLYHALACAAVRQADAPRAGQAFDKALDAARRLDEGWAEAADREHFRAGQARLLADARAFLEGQGEAEKAEGLAALFPTPEERRRRRAEARLVRDRRRHRNGRALALANLALAGVAAVVGLARQGVRDEVFWWVLAAVFAAPSVL